MQYNAALQRESTAPGALLGDDGLALGLFEEMWAAAKVVRGSCKREIVLSIINCIRDPSVPVKILHLQHEHEYTTSSLFG